MADPSPSQDDRAARLATPLGKDKLCLVRFEGHEAIGELFEFRIEAVSADANIDFNPKLGQNCSVHLDTTDKEKAGRDFSGVLTEARRVGKRGNLNLYRLVLRPWPWLLTLRANCKIYYKLSVKEIIRQALGNGAYGRIDVQMAEGPTLEYTVQYRETDLNFALRMMEKFGAYYYFTFDKGDGASPSAHTMVVADSTSFKTLSAPGSVLHLPPSAGERRDVQSVRDWNSMQGMVAGIFELTDYDYTKPNTDLSANTSQSYPYDKGSHVFDYPGGYDEKGLGETLTEVRRDADRRGERASSSGYAPSLTPGFQIKRASTGPDSDPEDDTYLIRHCAHWYGDQTYDSTGGAQATALYDGHYEFSRSAIPYRMPLRSRRPVVVGTQPAKVIRDEDLNPGEEIDVDDLGRIYVQFFWDREKKYMRRVRVAQVWAGSQRGALFTPRVGDEVVVAYEDGDPDRPIVVGSVYNGVNKVTMKLPDKKVKSGILTLSSKAGSGGYNMLLFDDTAGDEKLKVRTEKDLMFKAKNDQKIKIGNDRTDEVTHDINQTVGNNHNINVTSNYTLTADQQIVLQVGSSSITITAQEISIQSINISLTAEAQVSIAAPQTSITP